MRDMNAIDSIAGALLIIGGINWGLVGLFQYDLVAGLFGADSGISRTIYTLVGLAATYILVRFIATRTADSGYRSNYTSRN